VREKINGFLILKKTLAQTEPYTGIFCLGDKEYRGLERSSFEDVNVGDLQQLPSAIKPIIEMTANESNDTLFLPLIKDYEDALKILAFANRDGNFSELAVIYSDVISTAKGTIDFDGEKIEWLGFDIFVFGGGSLILNGLFFKPAYFYKWIDEVNANGLFTKKDNTQEYIDNYTECAKDNIVESYDLTDISFDVIRVGKTRQRQPYYT